MQEKYFFVENLLMKENVLDEGKIFVCANLP